MINIISGNGCGDVLMSFRLTDLLKKKGHDVYNYCCVRGEVNNMLKTILYQKFNFTKLPEDDYERLLVDENYFNQLKLSDETYFVIPDKLFRGKKSFPLKKYHLTGFAIKQNRLLIDKWTPENRISINLNSITENYSYHSIPELVKKIGLKFPDKNIYVPILTKWKNMEMPRYDFKNISSNIVIDYNSPFEKVFDLLCKSEYVISADSAIMHLCFDLGLPHIILDPQYNRVAWESRWRESGFYNSIPITALVEDIVDYVYTQITIPETQMIGADKIFRQKRDYSRELIFKE